MNKNFKIGCLHSVSSRWQVERVIGLIKPSGYQVDSIMFPDANQLDKALMEGTIDLVVLPAGKLTLGLPEEFELIAVTERLPVNDVVVSLNKAASLAEDKIKVGVTSEIKLAFLRRYYPKAIPALEPNPEMGFDKLENGIIDMMVMNYNEALPFGYDKFIVERIETSYFVPSAGQGSLAILCHKKLNFSHKEVLQHWVNHEETEDCLRAERSFLKTIAGTDTMMAFSYAHFEGALIKLKAGLISPDGKTVFKIKKSAVLGESRELGKKVALEVARSIDELRVQAI